MRKNTFTFRHEYNASYDPKIRKLLNKVGLDGLGLYWAVVEILYQQGGSFPRDSYTEIAHDFYTTPETVARVIEEFGLFEFDEDKVWNKTVNEQLSERENKADKAKKSAQSRWAKEGDESERNADAMQSQYERNAKKEIKGNNSITTSSSKDSEVRPLPSERTQDDSQETLLDFGTSGEDKELHQPESTSQNIASSPAVLTPHQCQNIADFWNRTVDEYKAVLPKVKTLGEDRIKKIRVRWKEFAEIGDPVEVTRVVFRNACSSKFFQEGSWGTFDWIFTNSKNWAKVYEGNYNDKSKGEVVPQEQPKPKKVYKNIQEKAAAEGWGL